MNSSVADGSLELVDGVPRRRPLRRPRAASRLLPYPFSDCEHSIHLPARSAHGVGPETMRQEIPAASSAARTSALGITPLVKTTSWMSVSATPPWTCASV